MASKTISIFRFPPETQGQKTKELTQGRESVEKKEKANTRTKRRNKSKQKEIYILFASFLNCLNLF